MERKSEYFISNGSAISLASPQEIVKLDFSQADRIYAAREPAAGKHLFIRERRALALNWLRLIRHRAALITFNYRIYLPNLRPNDRLKLMGNYALFLSVWAALFFLIRCSNPIHFSKLAALTLSRMERLSHLYFAKTLSCLYL
jgi:hypothetical protein